MRRSLFALAFLVILFGAPALFACETCLQPNEERNGTVRTRITCWTECEGDMTYCVVKEDFSGCSQGDLGGDECPDCENHNGGGGGGHTGGWNDDPCPRDASGACPASCSSCS